MPETDINAQQADHRDSLFAHGGDADTVDGFHAAATPAANKLLAADASARLPAHTVDGCITVDGGAGDPTIVGDLYALGTNPSDGSLCFIRVKYITPDHGGSIGFRYGTTPTRSGAYLGLIDGTPVLIANTYSNVGIGTIAPNANAILDLFSTTKAFMPPRMTTDERDSIADPTEGMVVYNLTTHALNFRNATDWVAV